MPVTLILTFFLKSWRRTISFAAGLVGMLLWHQSFALPMVPMTYNGSLSYHYSYSKADQAESEVATLSATVGGNGFIWQPWFVTLGVGLSVGVSESTSNTSDYNAASTVTSGNIQITVFPQSRFPFMLAFSRTDSRLENAGSSFSADSHYINTRLFLSQSYYGRMGSIAIFTWDHNKFESERSSASNDNLSGSFRGKHAKHRYSASAGYSRSERSGSPLEPSTTRIELQHNYIPSTELAVSTTTSYTRNDNGQSGNIAIFENVQASSIFGWRPVDRPYSITGGARVAASDSGSGAENKSMATNIGASYQFTRYLRMIAQALVNVSEAGGSRSVSSSESANINYYSQPYFVGGFSWNWNSALGFSNTNTDNDGEKQSQQSTAGSLAHSISRNWATGRTSSLNLAFSQSGSITKSSESDEAIYGLGHGIGLGWSRRGVSSGTYANVSVSDNRTSGENSTTYQQLNAQLTQRNTLTRVSALSANVVFQASKQDISGADDSSEPKTLSATASYTNSRTFGIYPLRFSTSLSYNKRITKGENDSETTESDSRLDYRVGLLTTSLSFRIMQIQGGTLSQTINFSLTRTF